MSYLNNQQKLNDIIFADRNQAYGAYDIRSEYGFTVFKSVSLMLLGVGAAISVAMFLSPRPADEPEYSGQILFKDSVYIIPVSLPEEKSRPSDSRPGNPKQQPSPSIANRHLLIVDSVAVAGDTTSADVFSLTASLNSGTGSGDPESGEGGDGEEIPGGGGGDKNGVTELYMVDAAPEFPGGLKGLYDFVSDHLRYPPMALAEGKGGTVHVRFVVDEAGQVSQLNLLNSAGYGMDEEALRVVGMIPRFKSPGMVNGTPVKTYYQFPIRFRLK
jgi:protein TonB